MISQVNPMLLPERKSVITTLTQHFFSADSRSCISDEADLTLVIAYLPLSIIPINFISPTDALTASADKLFHAPHPFNRNLLSGTTSQTVSVFDYSTIGM